MDTNTRGVFHDTNTGGVFQDTTTSVSVPWNTTTDVSVPWNTTTSVSVPWTLTSGGVFQCHWNTSSVLVSMEHYHQC